MENRLSMPAGGVRNAGGHPTGDDEEMLGIGSLGDARHLLHGLSGDALVGELKAVHGSSQDYSHTASQARIMD